MTQFETSKHYRLIEQAIQILEQCTPQQNSCGRNGEPTLAELARRLHTSPTHLQRVFTAWAGISPKQFFQCLQKDHARQLIAAGHSMLQVSTELGLPSTSKLHHLMLKFEAMTPGEIKNQGGGLTLTLGQSESPFGQIFACVTQKGLNSLEFETESMDYTAWAREISKLYPNATFLESNSQIREIAQQAFQLNSVIPSNVHLHIRGTPFQIQVWQALMHLPAGHLSSYQQLANLLRKPSASRAVGSAIAKNPIAYLIPCHRVIQATGELGQYRWSSTRKKALHIWEQGSLSTEPTEFNAV